MAFVAVLSRDRSVRALPAPDATTGASIATRVSGRLLRLVRERPVTAVVLDSGVFERERDIEPLVRELRLRFPSVGIVFLARPEVSPRTLLDLGRVGAEGQGYLGVLRRSEYEHGAPRALARAVESGAGARVQRAVGMRVPGPERRILRGAMDGTLLGWGAEDLSAWAGWTRPHLGQRLRAHGLPTVGPLLLWARVLHASRWLSDPGRTAESVSRQLDYANGATFRRALRTCLETTPTELRRAGGFGFAITRFLDVCGLDDSLGDRRSVA